jgi:hypothetical protein
MKEILMLRPSLIPLLLAALTIPGCDSRPTQPSTAPAESANLGTTQAIDAAAASAQSLYAPRFDPKDFVDVVDHRFFPLKPGTRWVYTGVEDGEKETNVVLVTGERKEILGVSATVVLDRVFVEGELEEKTFDWFAQDSRGNVWYLGEDTREFQDGKVVSTEGSWEAGVDGAVPGIIMPANPQPGQHYQQEFLKGEAEDEASITARGLDITVPFGSFHNCLKTVEFTRLEPGISEAKFYCPEIGFVKARGIQGPESRLLLKNVF